MLQGATAALRGHRAGWDNARRLLVQQPHKPTTPSASTPTDHFDAHTFAGQHIGNEHRTERGAGHPLATRQQDRNLSVETLTRVHRAG